MSDSKALQLSQRPATKPEEGLYLTFLLAREMFAISISNIKEIIEYGQVTPVPMVPDFVRGVINLRGQVVPVIDLQVRLGRENSQVGKRTCIVIVDVEAGEDQHEVLGILVDSVSEVLSIQNDQIERAPQFGSSLRSDFISGMGKIDGEFVVILNIEKTISLNELSALVSTFER